MPGETLTVILGGGRGTRLDPLTRLRCKPAVPLAGKYRLIDIAISNSINSKMDHIYVLTQFNSASLNRHVSRTYRFDSFTDGFVEVLAAEQTAAHEGWYEGTADAVRKQAPRFLWRGKQRALILPGDQLCRLDFRDILDVHNDARADFTIAAAPVERHQASRFGILRLTDDGRIAEYVEKPQDPATLDRLATPPAVLARLGCKDEKRCFVASMGTYVFEREALMASLSDPRRLDFGEHVIAAVLGSLRTAVYLFRGYWEDIGTISSFYRANIALGHRDPPFRFYDGHAPIYTRPRSLPSSKIYDCHIHDSIVADGCVLDACTIRDSVVGLRTRIEPGCSISETVLMGADFYQAPDERQAARDRGHIPTGIGRDTVIRRAIVDKNACIGAGVRIVNEAGLRTAEGPGYAIRDGIVVVTKNAEIADGTVI